MRVFLDANVLFLVALVGPGAERLEWAATLLPEKAASILVAACSADAHVLVTGDLRHFGLLMGRDDLPVRVLTVRELLLGGPHASHGASARRPRRR